MLCENTKSIPLSAGVDTDLWCSYREKPPDTDKHTACGNSRQCCGKCGSLFKQLAPEKARHLHSPVAMDRPLKRGPAVFWKCVRAEQKCGKSDKWTDDLWTDNNLNWLRVQAFEAPWKRADMQVGKVKVLIITLTFTCQVTNVARFHGNNDKYDVCRGKGGRGLVEPQPSGQRASVKFYEVGRESQNVAPNFSPTIIPMKKYLKINKTGLSRLVKGHNSPTNSNNLVGLCFQAYLSVHSSENGQAATHFTRQRTSAGNNE